MRSFLPPPVLRVVLLALLVLAIVASTGSAQTLERLRSDVRNGAPEKPHRDEEKHDDHDDHDDDHHHHCSHHDCGDSLFGEMLLLGLTSPFWGPPVMANDNYTRKSEFLSYPFKRGWEGHMVPLREPLPTKRWHLRVRSEYADDFDRLSRTGGHVLFDTTSRFGFDSEVNYREEDLPGGAPNDLWTGDFNVLFRFAQTDHFQMRTGLGFNWLADDAGEEFGFNFTYGGDWMPAEPWIVSGEIDWGKLGEAGLFHGRLTVGVQFHHVEIYAGYDYYDVGSVQIDGAVGGVRLWF